MTPTQDCMATEANMMMVCFCKKSKACVDGYSKKDVLNGLNVMLHYIDEKDNIARVTPQEIKAAEERGRQEGLKNFHKEHIEELKQESKEFRYFWSPCEGCPEGHSSFWKTIIESKQWEEWIKSEEGRNFDTSESQECGWFSKNHFTAFIERIEKQAEERGYQRARNTITTCPYQIKNENIVP